MKRETGNGCIFSTIKISENLSIRKRSKPAHSGWRLNLFELELGELYVQALDDIQTKYDKVCLTQ